MSRTETVQPAPLTFETGRVYTLTPIEAILAACAAWASVPTEDEDGNPLGGGRNDDAPSPLHTYLQHVAAAQRDNHGCYISRAAAREMQTSTSDAAYSSMTARTPQRASGVAGPAQAGGHDRRDGCDRMGEESADER